MKTLWPKLRGPRSSKKSQKKGYRANRRALKIPSDRGTNLTDKIVPGAVLAHALSVDSSSLDAYAQDSLDGGGKRKMKLR